MKEARTYNQVQNEEHRYGIKMRTHLCDTRNKEQMQTHRIKSKCLEEHLK